MSAGIHILPYSEKITRVEGGILVFLYIAYMGYAIVRDHLGADPIMSLIGN